jgi:ribosomal protein L11 methyltransferase
MKWLEYTQQVPQEFVEPISYLFHRYGRGTAIEETPGCPLVTLRTYIPSTSRVRRARIEVGVKLIGRIHPFPELQMRAVGEDEWEEAWKRHFTLMRIGRRVVIKPTWIEYTPAAGEIVVEIDPGMAFGTGHHQTTRMCLEALENEIRTGDKVLDFGCGSGILGITALKLGASIVVALDVDPVAVRVARENFRANGLRHQVRLAKGTLPGRLAENGRFDLVLANINAHVIEQAALHLSATLRLGGTLVASGILEGQAMVLRGLLEAAGFVFSRKLQQDDWVTLVMKKQRAT